MRTPTKTLDITVSPDQAIKMGWKLFWLGLWYSIRGHKAHISAWFQEK